MATAKERRDIFYNIVARVGLDGPVLEEYSKALSTLNHLKTYNELNPPMPSNLPPEQPMATNTGQITPEMGQSAPQSNNSLNIPK